MLTLEQLNKEVQKHASPDKAKHSMRFFKTGKGEYGEGDIFAGLTVPESRVIAVKFKDLSLNDVKELLHSTIHEERLIALLLLVHKFKKGDETVRKDIYDFYLASTQFVNNWDLVDLSAEHIVGGYLRQYGGRDMSKSYKVLTDRARSELLWDRRIAMMATFDFIKHGEYQETFRIADILLHDTHDLIQKAVGWMLREVGKRCSQEVEEAYLKPRYITMPRTMLRYAIEHFPPEKRSAYLKGEV